MDGSGCRRWSRWDNAANVERLLRTAAQAFAPKPAAVKFGGSSSSEESRRAAYECW
jgi:hypothetical protein